MDMPLADSFEAEQEPNGKAFVKGVDASCDRATACDRALKVATCILLAAIAVSLSSLVVELRKANDSVQLANPAGSPFRDVISQGISDGVNGGLVSTMRQLDVLGVEALADGTWLPALAYSTVHLNAGKMAALSRRAMAIFQDVVTATCDEEDETCQAELESNTAFMKVLGIIQFVEERMTAVPWPVTPVAGFPPAPNVSAWVEIWSAEFVDKQADSVTRLWEHIEAPSCKTMAQNFVQIDWQTIPYTWTCDTQSDTRCIPNSVDFDSGCPLRLPAPPHTLVTCHGELRGLSADDVADIGDTVSQFCESMATPQDDGP